MSDPEPTRLPAAEKAFEVAIRATGQALVDASAAAHEVYDLDPPKDDQDADYDRMLWLGKITDGLSALCTPALRPGPRHGARGSPDATTATIAAITRSTNVVPRSGASAAIAPRTSMLL